MISIYAAAAISDDHEDGVDDPKCYKEATKSLLAEKWHMAMKDEIDAISQHQNVGDFVDLPEGRKTIPCHWVYQIKRDGAGNVQRYNTRLICGGNHQIEGIDYQATYAPTAHLCHVMLALAIPTMYDLKIHQMDVWKAFFGVDLAEEISMHPPQGYFCFLQNGSWYNDPRLNESSQKMVFRFRKTLYGLKQSSHVWYGTFKGLVILIRFVASCVDGGMFVLHDNVNHSIVIATVVLYVDDLLIITNEGLIGQIKDQMRKRFRMHHLGSVPFYLTMNIERNREYHKIDIHRHCYIKTILVKFRIDESWPVATPMGLKLPRSKPNKEACNPTIYQSMIGSVMYTMTASRPDIAYAIGVFSWYNQDLSNEHMVAPKHVFWYLNGTKGWWLHFRGVAEDTLGCYVDSDYAGCLDNYISTMGLVFTFGEAVDWRSRK